MYLKDLMSIIKMFGCILLMAAPVLILSYVLALIVTAGHITTFIILWIIGMVLLMPVYTTYIFPFIIKVKL